MNIKTIFLLILAVLVTIILTKNTDEVNFWIFGQRSIPLLVVIGCIFLAGGIAGFMIGRAGRKIISEEVSKDYNDDETENHERLERKPLSDEDREYIS